MVNDADVVVETTTDYGVLCAGLVDLQTPFEVYSMVVCSYGIFNVAVCCCGIEINVSRNGSWSVNHLHLSLAEAPIDYKLLPRVSTDMSQKKRPVSDNELAGLEYIVIN